VSNLPGSPEISKTDTLTFDESIVWGRVYARALSIAEITGIPGNLVFDLASDFADQVIRCVRKNSGTQDVGSGSRDSSPEAK